MVPRWRRSNWLRLTAALLGLMVIVSLIAWCSSAPSNNAPSQSGVQVASSGRTSSCRNQIVRVHEGEQPLPLRRGQPPAPRGESRLLVTLATIPPEELVFRAQVERATRAQVSQVVDAWLVRRRTGYSDNDLQWDLEHILQGEPVAVRDVARRLLAADTAQWITSSSWQTGAARLPSLRRAQGR
jgi:hypothetical protein